MVATHSSSRAQRHHISLGLRPLSSPITRRVGAIRGGSENGRESQQQLLLSSLPDRETEAETLSNSPTVTKRKSVQDSNPGLIKLNSCLVMTLLCEAGQGFSESDSWRVCHTHGRAHPGVSDVIAPGNGFRIRISKMFPDGMGAAGRRNTEK